MGKCHRNLQRARLPALRDNIQLVSYKTYKTSHDALVLTLSKQWAAVGNIATPSFVARTHRYRPAILFRVLPCRFLWKLPGGDQEQAIHRKQPRQWDMAGIC